LPLNKSRFFLLCFCIAGYNGYNATKSRHLKKGTRSGNKEVAVASYEVELNCYAENTSKLNHGRVKDVGC